MSTGKFIIPNASKKRTDIKLLEAGPNPGILYSIIDEGTHYNKYFDKTSRTVRLIFEFPLLKQLFNENDTIPRPTVVSQEYTFTLGEKSNLKRIIDGAEGRILAPAEYRNGWDLSQYLGRIFIVEIVNKPNKKDPSVIYNNIGSIKGLTEGLRNKYNFDWDEVVRVNDCVSFFIDDAGEAFQSETLAKLPPYLYDKVCSSDEATKYRNLGGVIVEREQFSKKEDNVPPPAKRAPKAAQAPSEPIKKMLVTDYTYEEYKASGWTDEQLIEHKKMAIVKPEKSKIESAPPPVAKAPEDDTFSLEEIDDNDVPF